MYTVDREGNVFNRKGKQMGCGVSPNGYRMFGWSDSGKVKSTYVHRFVAQTYIENPEGLECVDHMDGDKTNNKVENLQWVTRGHNVSLGWQRGTTNPHSGLTGESANGSKLKERDVQVIRDALNRGVPGLQIATVFGVTKHTIYAIKDGRTWSTLHAELNISGQTK